MRIHRLTLENFRGFERETFNLNASFTAAIGDNGRGKSTLLHALRIATGTFFLGLPNTPRKHISSEEDIRRVFNYTSKQYEYITPTLVEAEGEINGSGRLIWRRSISVYGKNTSSKKTDIGNIKSLAEKYSRSINKDNRPLLPVIAYFGVRHMGNKIAQRKRTKSKRVLIRDGYYNALGQKSYESAFTEWLYNYDTSLASGAEFEGTREAMFEAIEKAIPYLKNLNFDRFYFQFEADVCIEGQPERKLQHQHMSDGVKRMLDIVADIAYRCVILNGFKGKNAIIESEGIVMIDELDMHLHPNWQRQIVNNLKVAFPKIQFVVTTHSPFIVQSLNADELINLDIPSDVAYKDLPLQVIATEVMGVESEFSQENQQKYELAKDILGINEYSKELTLEKISAISDPGLRAFLELQYRTNKSQNASD